MQIDLDALFGQSPLAYVLLDPDLRMVWANEAYLSTTGRRRDEVIGKLLHDVFPAPEDSQPDQMLRRSFRKVLDTGKVDHLPVIPYPIRSEDGTFQDRIWSATHTPILGEDGGVDYILQNTVDVTDFYDGGAAPEQSESLARTAALVHRAEAVANENLALGKMTEFFQAAFDHAPSFMAILHGPDHVFQVVNEAYTDLVGDRPLIGLSVAEALPEVQGQGFLELLDQVYREGEPVSIRGMPARVEPHPGAEPEEHYIDFIFYPLTDATGKIHGIFVQGHDITAQKTAEAELSARREKFRIMAQTMPNHVWTADTNGGLDWLNDRIYEFTGLKEGDLYGSDWVRVVHPDDLPDAAALWENAMEEGRAYETEFRIRKADGSYRWHIVRASPLRTADGTLTGWVGTNTDIEERKTIEAEVANLNASLEARVAQRNQELEVLNAALRQSQKLEAIGGLAGGIAHDFNNLLQVLTGNIQSALRDSQVPAVRARLEQAMGAVERGAMLASQLLSFARKQPLAPVVLNLTRLVDDMAEMLHSAIGEGVEVEIHKAEDLWRTSIDPNSMENALLNLAINARDAMDGQGKLTIALENRTLDEAFAKTQPGATPGDYVCLTVSDTGCGIPRETIDRIFDPFFTTKEDGHGTGLGLSMVYGFAKQSGGHITIDSTVGAGTTMTLYLPRSDQPEEEAQARNAVALRGGTETILLVEDDAAVREVGVNMLSDLGYTVLQADGAASALDILRGKTKIDLLFTDVVMPGVANGQELAEQARKLRPDLRVLFTSGFVQDAIVHEGRLDAGVELIGKPYTREQLAPKIRQILGSEGVPLAGPTNNDTAAEPATPPTPKPDSPAAGRVILLCEDDALIRMDMADELRDAGHEVIEVGTGKAALEELARAEVDLFITDLGLPDYSGEDLAHEVRKQKPQLPVIFATGDAHVAAAETMDRCKVLTKPFRSDVLKQAVEALTT
ncbi:PAS domain-containing protein [Thalassorhabdomicrobium marinisediminis]|uniref:histidine kinase n=1 Tax=Thalassorhabdomicrobium marinisediminis TaxID=2170577 RepID=A0A2T7FV01_9RHOB|nr:PAS domain-containing protein [Thalassorhabdomicrobium marinisediminis]PVA05982.1 hybrid sensor histidine kinase/response regulator [Thalassorhabdomicrobium marinisediminis]